MLFSFLGVCDNRKDWKEQDLGVLIRKICPTIVCDNTWSNGYLRDTRTDEVIARVARKGGSYVPSMFFESCSTEWWSLK